MKNDDFMKKLAPRNIDEYEEMFKKYPIPDRTSGAADSNIVDEPVDVIGKTPWYRSKILYSAAAFVFAAAVGVFFLNRTADIDTVTAPSEIIPDAKTVVEAPVDEDEFPLMLAPVTDEWMQNVYFGSEFPYIIYADDETCIFTEGMSSIFVYDFESRNIVHSANIRETLDNAMNDGLLDIGSIYTDYFISFSCYAKSDDTFGLVCFASNSVENIGCFEIDFENNCLIVEDEEFARERAIVPYDDLVFYEIDDMLSKESKEYHINEDEFIYLANNHLCDDVTPGNGSHIYMIDIRKCSIIGDMTEGYRPFEMKPDEQVETDAESKVIGSKGFYIRLPKSFEATKPDDPSVEPTHYEMTMENGDVICFEYLLVGSYFADKGIKSFTAEDVVERFQRVLFTNETNKTDIEYWKFEFDTEEERMIANCRFIYHNGEMGNTSPFVDSIPVYLEEYFGVVPCYLPVIDVEEAPLKMTMYTISDNEDTLNYMHELMTEVAESAYVEIPVRTECTP